MHPNFSQLTPRWFKRAFVYTGNIDDFRYRFEMDKDNGLLHTAVYTVYPMWKWKTRRTNSGSKNASRRCPPTNIRCFICDR